MSMQDGVIRSPVRRNMQINYADPGGVGNIVVGAERRTGITQFDFKRSNIIIDARATTAPAGADDHLLSIRRLNGTVVDFANWTDILPANNRDIKGVVPFGIAPGTFQWIMEEIVAAAAGVNVVYTMSNPVAM